MKKHKKVACGFRLSPEAIDIVRELADRLGVSQSAVVELALRKMNDTEKRKDKKQS